jgi:hypothetical protein
MLKFRVAVSLMIALSAGPAFARQGGAQLRGTVADQHDAVLEGVVLRVRNQETGVYRVTRTNPDGTYSVSGLPPGRYEIQATLPGFKQSAQSGVRLEVGRTNTLDITLIVGPIAESVKVEAQTPLVDTASKTVGGHIASNELLGRRVRRTPARHRPDPVRRAWSGCRQRQRDRSAEQQFPARRRQQ